ncbi:MAG TPA: efflux RND transporter periplasmic adaptor subunit [Thermoanaerobaculia bacterium]|nr:efflux RND transporter periplasmic adaptor subunit [Thermoanaerobaculia bacterium]
MLRRLLLALAIVAALALLVWWAMRPKPVEVVVAEIGQGRVERSVANTRAGTVSACRRAKLAPPAGGQIVAIPVREGMRVEAGQVLLELWNEEAAAQARMAEQQARGAGLRAEEVCGGAAVAQRDADRARTLHRDGLLPDDQLDRAVSAATNLRAACNAARADVQQGEARVAAARAALTRTVLRAPFAGVVARITGELGEFTTPSPPGIPTPPAVDLIDDSCLYVVAPIDEVDVARVRPGQPAWLTIDAMAGQRFPGRVRRVAPYVLDLEKQARTVDVEVEFANPDDAAALLAGYSADAEIILEVRENVLRVPTQALLEGNRVLVLGGGRGTIEERRIETGVSNWQFTEVVSGLAAGEQVIVSVDRKGVVPGARAVAGR